MRFSGGSISLHLYISCLRITGSRSATGWDHPCGRSRSAVPLTKFFLVRLCRYSGPKFGSVLQYGEHGRPNWGSSNGVAYAVDCTTVWMDNLFCSLRDSCYPRRHLLDNSASGTIAGDDREIVSRIGFWQ